MRAWSVLSERMFLVSSIIFFTLSLIFSFGFLTISSKGTIFSFFDNSSVSPRLRFPLQRTFGIFHSDKSFNNESWIKTVFGRRINELSNKRSSVNDNPFFNDSKEKLSIIITLILYRYIIGKTLMYK